jgi:hypothetical protein
MGQHTRQREGNMCHGLDLSTLAHSDRTNTGQINYDICGPLFDYTAMPL